MLQNGRGGEKTTLRHFLAFWIALTEDRDWKETYLDPKVVKCMEILTGEADPIRKVALDTKSSIQVPVKVDVTEAKRAVDNLDTALKAAGIRK